MGRAPNNNLSGALGAETLAKAEPTYNIGAKRAKEWRMRRSQAPARSRAAQEDEGESSRDGSLLCTPRRVAAVKLVTNADTPVIQRALRMGAGVADTAAAIIFQEEDAQAGLDRPAREGTDGADDACNAQATNSTPTETVSSSVAGNRDQADFEQSPDRSALAQEQSKGPPALAQEQSPDPSPLAQEQSMGQDDGHSESHHGAEAPQKSSKKQWSGAQRRRSRREKQVSAAAHDCDDDG